MTLLRENLVLRGPTPLSQRSVLACSRHLNSPLHEL